MRRLLSAVCVLGVVTALAGPGVSAQGRGEAPGVPPVVGDAFDPGPLDSAVVDAAAPPVPQSAADPLQSIIGEPGAGESVIGTDQRTRVTDTTTYPSSAIGFLTFTQGGGGGLCSGFLVDPNTVLTAGHCVHGGGPGGQFSEDITFTPGRDGATAPFGSCGATDVGAAPLWVTNQDEAHDWGWVQLDCLIGHLVGWFGYTATGDVGGDSAIVRGYPADKPQATMWTADGTIDEDDGAQVFYAMDTSGGQSGSPVYDADLAACGGPCAVAVHAYGLHGAPPHSELNHGTRLDEPRAAVIAGVAAANDRTDDEGPTITIEQPTDGAVYPAGARVVASYECRDEPTGSGIRSCEGPVADGAPIDTTPGVHPFTVVAEDGAGNVVEETVTYEVLAEAPPAGAGEQDPPVHATPTFTG